MNAAASFRARNGADLRAALRARPVRLALPLLIGAVALWWLLSWDKIGEHARNEEVEMIDIAVPPPPPPPPVTEEQTEIAPDQAAPTPTQTVQPDPLSPPAPPSANPPAGDLSSLLQDPSAESGAFVGGRRGQGGTGTGALIGGTGTGGAQASRAYAEAVNLHIQRHVRRHAALSGKPYGFRLRVSVSPSGAISIRGLSGFDPAEREPDVRSALGGLAAMSSPPPEGLPNVITLTINSK
ncbi:MAG: hypothetical protein B7Z08_06150 [Sphingomonadales bacterium 32-68-7]|nr:MAG: hypothetical protein B7Z33_10205 [Sphingomonadales bacterium 12-68-11]OYX09224.1 MAG: hypothetical protein B7Z08_06150 [Sphingomonadales bacterium 32-68-7]